MGREALIKLKAKPVTKGIAEGEAVVPGCPSLSPGAWIRTPGHELQGRSVAGRILVFPTGKGSTTGSWQYYAAYKRGNAPMGIMGLLLTSPTIR
jgi:predicted aconitase with swiveling domain